MSEIIKVNCATRGLLIRTIAGLLHRRSGTIRAHRDGESEGVLWTPHSTSVLHRSHFFALSYSTNYTSEDFDFIFERIHHCRKVLRKEDLFWNKLERIH